MPDPKKDAYRFFVYDMAQASVALEKAFMNLRKVI
jgi:hypothetical protein